MASDKPILFYDGECGLCDRFVQFVLAHDLEGHFNFAALQGETAKRLLHPELSRELSTVVLYEQGRVQLRSDAALAILARLPGMWRLTGVFKLVPPFARDFIYDRVARRRLRFFGRLDTCRIPTGPERTRFLP